jgi:alpha-D-ribose 1-methylphosphonate 5-triphosphate diphosphatase
MSKTETMDLTVGQPPLGAWPLCAAPTDYVLGHVRAVLPDRVLDDALIAVRDGLIAEVAAHPAGVAADVDGSGLLCLPGLVDMHSDGLEKERLPRPGAVLPLDFALISFEGKLHAAGVTTVFHGAAFEHSRRRGLNRTVDAAEEICDLVATRDAAIVDHRILYRLDVRCPNGLAALRNRIAAAAPGALVSHEDHTPGIGQYADRAYYERYVMGNRELTAEEARVHVDELIEERAGRLDVLEEAMAWLGDHARSGDIRLLGHDLETADDVTDLVARGGTVAEFPTTLEAAATAREHSLPVVMGAPNVLRGSSHNGNTSGRDLIGRGLVTALASDYLPSGLLAAAFAVAADGLTDLAGAIRLVTGGAASAAGLTDRGSLLPGQLADLVLVEGSGRWPQVRTTVKSTVPR